MFWKKKLLLLLYLLRFLEKTHELLFVRPAYLCISVTEAKLTVRFLGRQAGPKFHNSRMRTIEISGQSQALNKALLGSYTFSNVLQAACREEGEVRPMGGGRWWGECSPITRNWLRQCRQWDKWGRKADVRSGQVSFKQSFPHQPNGFFDYFI